MARISRFELLLKGSKPFVLPLHHILIKPY
nr:MAG TPA: hypothetical protein [Caudoviricetes sp.]